MKAQRPRHPSMPSILWPNRASQGTATTLQMGGGERRREGPQTHCKAPPPSGTRVPHGVCPHANQ